MAKKVVAKTKKEDESKVFAFLGVFLTIIGFVIVYALKRDDKYAMYYAKQGLVLGIAWVAIAVLGMIPILGWIAAPILWLIVFVLWVIGIVKSLSGEMKPIPLIGHYADSFNL